MQPDIERSAEGSTGQVELRQSFLEDFDLVLPKSEFQEKFSEFVRPLVSQMAVLEVESQHLTSLRDWILPMLMNGQVKVS
jgi:type I restriction enzyme S subunit